jgi:predicted Zn finger-like uncharacterized protein
MKLECPTCHARYRISPEKIALEKGSTIQCKKCGGQIEIVPPREQRTGSAEAAESPSGTLVPPDSMAPPPHGEEGTGEFQFELDEVAFAGYAGFWRRFSAAIIDGVLLMAVSVVIGAVMGIVYGAPTVTSEGASIFGNLVGALVGWLYYATMESSVKQGTLGKLALKIKVTDLSGNQISFARATIRHFGKIISTILLFIGFLMIAFTSRKQALHDMMAGCLVVKRP